MNNIRHSATNLHSRIQKTTHEDEDFIPLIDHWYDICEEILQEQHPTLYPKVEIRAKK